MTDTLRSRIIAHTDQPDIYDPPTREAMYARILRDAETIKAAEAFINALSNRIAAASDADTEEACNDILWGMLRDFPTIAAAFRAAQEKNDG